MLDVQLPQVKTAVQDYASTRGVSVQVATDFLAAEFLAEAISNGFVASRQGLDQVS